VAPACEETASLRQKHRRPAPKLLQTGAIPPRVEFMHFLPKDINWPVIIDEKTLYLNHLDIKNS
jgi:hypothetical protein